MRILRDIRAALALFLGGHEHGVCVLRGPRDHLPFVYRLLQELEATSVDVFAPFPHRFAGADAYAELIAARVEASGRDARGPAWALPEACRDREQDAAERIRRTLACARDLLPRGRATPRLVAVVVPLELADERAHAALVRGLIEPGSSPPWFRRMRIFVHAPADDESPLPRFVRAVRFDLSSAALAASAAKDAEDPARSREQRAQSLLQAAMLDLGQRRFEVAARGFDRLHAEAQALQNPVLAALALGGLGDVERLQRRPAAAIAWYERALVPASAAAAPIVLLGITRHLADLYLASKRDADAEVFFDGAQQLARAIPEPETQVNSLIGRGLAQQRRGGAAATWAASFAAAAEVARDNDCHELLAELRPRLKDGRRHELPEALRRSIDALLGGGA